MSRQPDDEDTPVSGDRRDLNLTSALLGLGQRVGRGPAVVLALALVGSVGLADYAAGPDLALSVFYLLPVLLGATVSGRIGLMMAAIGTATWLAADILGRATPYQSAVAPLWNGTMRFLVFSIVVTLVSALSRSVAHERQNSRNDPLSGLANSRSFYEAAAAELARLARFRSPLTVVYLDIDDFKLVNDALGHAAGDEVITETGAALTRSLRTVDTVARLGGDEFAILLPGTDEVQAEEVLRRLHAALMAVAVEHGWPIGFSIGAVTFCEPPASVDALIGAADQAMYRVKRAAKRGPLPKPAPDWT